VTTIAFDARFVNDRFDGIGRHAYNLLEALTRLDQARRYLVFYHPGYTNRRFDLRRLAQRHNVELRPIRLPLYLPTEQVVWPSVLAREKVALFHSPYLTVPIAARTALALTLHDLIFERFPNYMPWRWLRHYYNYLTRSGVRAARLVLTVSHATRRDIEAFYPAAAGKLRVTGNAVDASFRREKDPTLLEAVRKRYELPERFVLALGAGRPHKNLGMLVDAFAQLDPSTAPALVLAGARDARFDDEVEARTRAGDLQQRVVRPGRIREEDLPALYSLAELFVLPSLVEGFGMPVLEAMACGTPVLASNASSVPEVAGDAAISFDPLERQQLAREMERLLLDPSLRADLSLRGVQRAAAFTWDRVAESTLQAYGDAI
jgi:alpha-1,3-rhamnosyl/mannosyltransferase